MFKFLRKAFSSNEKQPNTETIEVATDVEATKRSEVIKTDEAIKVDELPSKAEQQAPLEEIEAVPTLIPMPITPTPEPKASERKSWLQKLKTGLGKTASNLTGVFQSSKIDDSFYDNLEDALLMADSGSSAASFLIEKLKKRVKEKKIVDPALLKDELIDILTAHLAPLEKTLEIGAHPPTVMMVVGVNGAGKTTSIGKLTKYLCDQKIQVLLACADTFRAAAKEQLMVWADRNFVETISQHEGDPAAVSFDAVSAGKARKKDVVIIDTAGRLPTQLHLMDELKKIKRVVTKAGEVNGMNADNQAPPHEIILVVDGNTGQNALMQVKAFDEALNLTGIVVTKLDGTAKGGILAAIAREKPIPIYFIGVGEKLDELETFNAHEFAVALLS